MRQSRAAPQSFFFAADFFAEPFGDFGVAFGDFGDLLVFGDLNGSRVKYIHERINLLEMGETPATNKYLDGSGKTCTWDEQPKQPEPIVEPKEPEPVVTYPAWTYFSAREWRSWYRGEPCASAYATMPSDGAAVGRVV